MWMTFTGPPGSEDERLQARRWRQTPSLCSPVSCNLYSIARDIRMIIPCQISVQMRGTRPLRSGAFPASFAHPFPERSMVRHLIPAILLLASTPAFAQAPAAGPNRMFTGSDLFDLEVARDPQISPDGSRIAYVRRSNDVMTDSTRSTIWLIDVKSGAQTPLVAGRGNHFLPRWSPDGTRLAYVSTTEGGR